MREEFIYQFDLTLGDSLLNRNSDLERLLDSWKEVRPPLHKILSVRTRRFIYRNRINRNYLNGDLFKSFADVSIQRRSGLILISNARNLSRAQIIFCESLVLQDFLDAYVDSLTCKVIIAGNSDHEFHNVPSNLPPNLKHLFLQNSFIPNSDLVTCLPIGIENKRYAVNGSSKLMKNYEHWNARSGRLLFGPYGLTHPERVRTVRELFGSPNYDFLFGRLGPKEYASVSSRYKFVACLRGNGIDTHRFWETIYRGGVPVVEDSIWAQNIKSLNVPMVITKSWSPEDIDAALVGYGIPYLDSRSIPTLWPKYWQERIQGISPFT